MKPPRTQHNRVHEMYKVISLSDEDAFRRIKMLTFVHHSGASIPTALP